MAASTHRDNWPDLTPEVGPTEVPLQSVLILGPDDEVAATYRSACPHDWTVTVVDPLVDSERLREVLPEVTILLHRGRPFGRAELELAGQLRLIQRHGVGLDSLDNDLIKKFGVPVCVNPVGTDAAAEHAVLLLLAAARCLAQRIRDVRDAGRWEPHRHAASSFALAGCTVGILGVGRIGRRVAELLAPFGCEILTHRRSASEGVAGATEVGRVHELFSRSDAVSIHLPLDASTRGLVGQDLIEEMLPGSVLVNTSRGRVLVEQDVVAALQSGRLAAFAADVLAGDDPAESWQLVQHPRSIVTPHAAAATADTHDRKAAFSVRNMLHVVTGHPLYGRVT